jgi:hypothetical protein
MNGNGMVADAMTGAGEVNLFYGKLILHQPHGPRW